MCSGSLTRYELQWALEDFGFNKEEQTEVFQAVDADNSGSVTLGEFLAGMGEGTVSFAGRESKSSKKASFLEIGLKMSKVVNQKEQPVKILSISPGLFGQIFKIFCDFAMKDRLYHFAESSCLFSAPKTSAVVCACLLCSLSSSLLHSAVLCPALRVLVMLLNPNPNSNHNHNPNPNHHHTHT